MKPDQAALNALLARVTARNAQLTEETAKYLSKPLGKFIAQRWGPKVGGLRDHGLALIAALDVDYRRELQAFEDLDGEQINDELLNAAVKYIITQILIAALADGIVTMGELPKHTLHQLTFTHDLLDSEVVRRLQQFASIINW